jgi:predicted lipoprotein with Yx(FWY)xxD motif
MSRKNVVALAALAAVSAVLLSACAGGAPADATVNTPLALLSGSATTNGAPEGTGDWANRDGGPALTGSEAEVSERWVELDISAAGELDPVMANGAGLTLYRFDNDTATPPASNCFDACAEAWPPVVVRAGGKIHVDPDLDQSLVGFIPRGEGMFQVTLAGWPLYRFAQDSAPGQARGQGVGDTWFGVTPQGERAGVKVARPGTTKAAPRAEGGSPASARPTREPAAQAPDRDTDNGNADNHNNNGRNNGGSNNNGGNTATGAILFDDAGFPDSGNTQGVSNANADATGCVDVARPNVRSITATGTYTIWSDAGCKGKSLKLEGNVADLKRRGFDNAVRSIKLRPAH